MNKIEIQNNIEIQELLSEEATVCDSGNNGVTAAYLHFVLCDKLVASSLQWFNLEDDFLVLCFGCINKQDCKFLAQRSESSGYVHLCIVLPLLLL